MLDHSSVNLEPVLKNSAEVKQQSNTWPAITLCHGLGLNSNRTEDSSAGLCGKGTDSHHTNRQLLTTGGATI